MRALVYDRHGPPDAVRLEEIPKPSLSAGGVLVSVRGAAANPYDWHFLRGKPYFMRLLSACARRSATLWESTSPGSSKPSLRT